MEWLILGTAVICLSYFALIATYYIGWSRTSAYVSKGTEQMKVKMSVVVACRNEEATIRQLIGCLAQQSHQDFELILVNDHSTDATRNYILTAQTSFPKIQLVNAIGYGKKNALKEGILLSSGKLIVTTDADCLPSYHWLETIAGFYARYPADLIICPVKLSWKDSLFSSLQDLEFTSLIASGAGAAGAGMPVLCNGANMAFTRNSWLAGQEDLHDEELSGDDMFLLESIKKRKGIIRFLKSESAFVTTKQANTVGEFIKQRRRWISKAPAYTDGQIILTACLVLLINVFLLALFSLSFFYPTAFMLFIFLFLIKYGLDTVFLYSVREFFQLNNVWFHSFLLSLFYPFYSVLLPLSALLVKPVKWK